MADRSALSPVCSGLVGLSRATSLTGILVGDVISSTVPWAKANPVIAPHVLRLTSAVACCHVGFLTGCTRSPSSVFAGRLDGLAAGADGGPLRQLAPGRLLRIAWTWAFPGLFAFAKSTLT